MRGMTGADCAERIERALRNEPAVFGAVASHATGRVEVDFEDDEISIDRLAGVIAGQGYDVAIAG